jgi:hypothetical protein
MVPRPVISPTLALRAAWSTNCSVVRALMNACSRACCSILMLPWLGGIPSANNSAPSEHPTGACRTCLGTPSDDPTFDLRLRDTTIQISYAPQLASP